MCGEDALTGDNYDHRKQWIVSRLKFLSYVYAIDICAYAVMSNHYHVVLHVDKTRALAWSQEEVAERWMQVCHGDVLVSEWLANPRGFDKTTRQRVCEIIEGWRERLYSLSWFMRCMNETIARMANAEDNCKGRFWEGRFKSQALLDEVALLSCMTYVDLNPIRAALEKDLINSDFTSIQQRLYDFAKSKKNKNHEEARLLSRVNKQLKLKEQLKLAALPQAPLMPFSYSANLRIHNAIPFDEESYIELVDSTGRLILGGGEGFIDNSIPPILKRLRINPAHWLEHVRFFNLNYSFCVGRVERMRQFTAMFDRGLGKGSAISQRVYS